MRVGTTLPYLIRTRRKLPVYYSYALYNEDFIGYSSFDESDDDDSSSKAVEPFSLDGVSTLSDEEYVVVDNVEVLPNSKTETMVLSKDTGADSDA
ncbi:hypothetical protein F2Q69_00056989 [Brassica cretica]|uniref:Uncharacterized protein n=1 Tax=Brassica cretica TaxID=69181 RepID=A0A8S9N5Z4_BRACR|nr:hypothetical protein F2Q69_00056989 [Brassica cretica]